MVGAVFGLMNITWEMFRRTIIGVCIWADGVDEYESEEVLQDNHRSCICAEEGVDEYKPEELRQRAQIGWQVKVTATDIICGIVMGLLLFVILMLLLLLASSSHEWLEFVFICD
jgi:hypothetical protein